jgi:glycerophosphoryl diester phosphodiesterase
LGKLFVIAHRGASAFEPENTLRAVRRALDLGADMVEVDVRESRDGYIVVIHDATVDRTTDGRGCVKDMSLRELRMLDAGLGERIPTLEEVAKMVKGKAKLVVEVKVPGIEGKVVRLVEESSMENEALVTSFYHPVLRRVKSLNNNVRTGVIIASRPVKPVQLALDAESNALFPKHVYVDREMVLEAHENGLPVYPWTVDTLEELKRLIEMQVDGVVTNKPNLLSSRNAQSA